MGDSFTWVGPATGGWATASNWNDVTAGQNPASAPPGAANDVTINAASGGVTQVITGVGSADTASIHGDTLLSGQFALTALNLSGGLLSLGAGDILAATGELDLTGVYGGYQASISVGGAAARLTTDGELVIQAPSGNDGLDSQISVTGGGYVRVGGVNVVSTGLPDSVTFTVDGSSAFVIGPSSTGGVPAGSFTVEQGETFYAGHSQINAPLFVVGGSVHGGVLASESLTISASTVTITGLVDYANLDASTITNSGTIGLFGDTITGSLINNGTVDVRAGGGASVGTIDGTVSGSGEIQIRESATLDLTHAKLGSNAIVSFEDAHGTLDIGAGSLDSTGNLGGLINGFGATDAIDFTGAVTSLSYWGGELTLVDGSTVVAQLHLIGDFAADTFFANPIGGGMTQITMAPDASTPPAATVDNFDGRGLSEILWRDDSGTTSLWLQAQGPGFTGEVLGQLPTNGTFSAVADINGDGKADLVWRGPDGDVGLWLSNPDPNSITFTNVDLGVVTNSWTIQKLGDFGGTGQQDILWRYSNGDVALWLAKPGSGYAGFNGQDLGVVSPSWTIQQVGDFSGDGKDDVLWRNANGDISIWHANNSLGFTGFTGFTGQDLGVVSPSWTIQGVGDFSGGGKDDILWHNTNGDVSIWHANSGAGYTGFTGQELGIVSPSWMIEKVGDYNGDGKADILWRNTNGDISIWMSNSGAGYTGMTGHELGVVSTDWHIV